MRTTSSPGGPARLARLARGALAVHPRVAVVSGPCGWVGVMTKKLVCLDVDGTIVDHDGHLHEPVRAAVRAVLDAGHHVVIATGRSRAATLPVARSLGIGAGFMVCSNGGVTLRLDPELEEGYEVTDLRTFDPRSVLTQLRHRLPSAKYALELPDGTFRSTERFQDMSFGVAAEGVTFEELMDTTAVRLVVFSTDSSAEEFGRAVEGIGLSGVTYSVGWTAWLDVAAAGVTKASGLEALRTVLKVAPEDTVAVGDGRNDIEMLRWAGRGVAMGQAVEEVVAAADEVTGHVDEHGLATVLRSLLEEPAAA